MRLVAKQCTSHDESQVICKYLVYISLHARQTNSYANITVQFHQHRCPAQGLGIFYYALNVN